MGNEYFDAGVKNLSKKHDVIYENPIFTAQNLM